MAQVMNLISRSFGRRLRKVCKDRFRTARALAEAAALEENTLTRWMRGETEPSFEILLRLCHLLGVTPNDLLMPHPPQRQQAPIKAKKSQHA